MTVVEEKALFRSAARRWLGGLAPAGRAAESAGLRGHLAPSAVWRGARTILVTLPLADEPDLTPLYAAAEGEGKTLAAPAFDAERGCYGARVLRWPPAGLARGPHGASEPGRENPWVAPESLDLALVPGLAFDFGGARLGRGGGWFDRLLAETPATRCGVAFSGQIHPRIPTEPHDYRMEWLATPTGVLRSRP